VYVRLGFRTLYKTKNTHRKRHCHNVSFVCSALCGLVYTYSTANRSPVTAEAYQNLKVTGDSQSSNLLLEKT
jgi:hypothetical protein